jgi:hypothetical protein
MEYARRSGGQRIWTQKNSNQIPQTAKLYVIA